MSGLLPANTTLQLGNNFGDITHQGVLGSNASGTTLLTSTFPTTATGDSLGHYMYTESSINSLKFLNASGTGQGGHQFWHSSSTEAPIKVMETNRTGVIASTNFSADNTPNKSVLQPDNLTISNSSTNNNITLINDVNNPSLTLTNTFFQQGIYATGGVQLANNNNNSQSTIESSQIVMSQNTNSLTTTSAQIRFQTVGETNAVFIDNSISPIIRLNNNTTGESILSATDLTFGGISILPTPNTFTFTIGVDNYSLSCITAGNQYTMTSLTNFDITFTGTQLLLNTSIDFATSFLSVVLFRDNVFYPLQVDLPTGRIISLTGDFSGTQTIYFSGIIFSSIII